MRTYLELIEGSSSKFWEIVVDGDTHTVRYGRIGTQGRESVKSFDDEDDALEDAKKLIAAKKKKGYAAPAASDGEGELTSVEALQEEFDALEEADGILDMVGSATVIRGDVVSAHDGLLALAKEQGDEGTLLVIDGDLTCTAERLGWGDREEFSNDVLLVTGDMTVNNLELSEVGVVIVGGSLRAKNIFVSYGDNGGSLSVGKDLEAKVVIADTYFVVDVQGKVKVDHVIGGTYATDFATNRKIPVLCPEEDANVFIDELTESGELDEHELFERLVKGQEVFVNQGKPRDGAYDKQW